jgi:hypothetical protein
LNGSNRAGVDLVEEGERSQHSPLAVAKFLLHGPDHWGESLAQSNVGRH